MKRLIYSLIVFSTCGLLYAGGLAMSRAPSRSFGGEACTLAMTFDDGSISTDYSPKNDRDVFEFNGTPTITNVGGQVYAVDFTVESTDAIKIKSSSDDLRPRTGPYTAEVSFKSAVDFSGGTSAAMIDLRSGSDSDLLIMYLLVAGDKLHVQLRDDTESVIVADVTDLTDDKWHHVLMTWTNPVMSVYLDGSLLFAATNALTVDINPDPGGDIFLFISNSGVVPDVEWGDTIDDVFIFKRHFSAAQARQRYELFKGPRK